MICAVLRVRVVFNRVNEALAYMTGFEWLLENLKMLRETALN